MSFFHSLLSGSQKPTHFISSTGSDANDGLTEDTPWQTLAKVNASTFAPGDRIGFKKGDTWREVMTIHDSGTAGNPIVYTGYGTGAIPRIMNSLDCSGLTWTVHSGSIYKATKTGMPAICNAGWLDTNTLLIKAATLVALDAAGEFFNDNAANTLYVWLPDSTSPQGKTIELSKSASTVLQIQKNYITIDGIRIGHGGGVFCVLAYNFGVGSNNNNIVNCEIGPSWKDGILIGVNTGTIKSNYVHDCWNGLEYPSQVGAGISSVNDVNTDLDISSNLVERCAGGIRLGGPHQGTIVAKNTVLHNHVNGIDVQGGVNGFTTSVLNNTVWHKPTGTAGHGIDIQLGTAGHGLISKNNIVYSDFEGVGGLNVQMMCIDNTTYTGTDVNNNCYFSTPAYTGALGKLGVTEYDTLAEFQTALNSTTYSGKEASSINDDPLFTDDVNDDYTLQGGSPCINAGVDVGLPFNGVAPDMGAYEV